MFIKRDATGKIVAISKVQDAHAPEYMDDDHPELQIFMRSLKIYQQHELAQTDQSMARVVEDVINLLVEKNLIFFTDLPDAAQQKLLTRRAMRRQDKLSNLIDDTDDLNI
ncbi:MAG: hypothetical protein IPK77_16655 [Cellvibrio sp.]|jgi:hypothetical protein|nr:hypothetical protein [Cellvibrio sp.]